MASPSDDPRYCRTTGEARALGELDRSQGYPRTWSPRLHAGWPKGQPPKAIIEAWEAGWDEVDRLASRARRLG